MALFTLSIAYLYFSASPENVCPRPVMSLKINEE
ncbi:hypothetical protein predicted by Glimmer/Critica [Bdellovibrio bacteriovorus HD100]|uniref:Uncharacterized protein n=1 Tax=Bdellovibrio bacteriovorus (strain ATCC 15356 / DSM 50701 / NCIMB 9529 / HD100) TaxID=264462 RepID=Q6MLK8_BDEBA|nr:hypothetical protein predicted by Glimmer/Critica [Bdellovibrio bacteriovorus HD100]